MGVKPNSENVNREENNRPKRDITCQYNSDKIQNKIKRKLGILTDQSIQSGLNWSVY